MGVHGQEPIDEDDAPTDSSDNSSFRDFVEAAMEKLGLTPENVADALNLKPEGFQQLLDEELQTKADYLPQLSAVLRVPLVELRSRFTPMPMNAIHALPKASDPSSAVAQVQKLVAVKQAEDPKLSHAAAVTAVLNQDSALYRAYVQETRVKV